VDLRFVTSNPGKVREADGFLRPLGHRAVADSTPTTEVQADDLETVARSKADSVLKAVPRPFFVEDAGLFVDSLRGFPGVYTAWALKTVGCDGVLRLLGNSTSREAHFEAVVAYVPRAGALRIFRGRADGTIASRKAPGPHGFGFDPIFLPEGSERTFAELATEEKSAKSHRGRALALLVDSIVKEGP
jgi:XTP/dITP diphosphohydrolase